MRVALLLFSTVLFAQSQPPSPAPPKAGQADQKQPNSKTTKAEPKQQPSAQSPVIAPSADGIQKQSSNPGEDDSSGDGELVMFSNIVMAFATVAIAILAYCQWQTLKEHKTAFEALAKHMGDGLIETTKAADAATKSAAISETALKLTQCADILTDVMSILDATSRVITRIDPHSHVAVGFKNFGHTRAEKVIYKVWLDIPDVPISVQSLGPSVLGAGDTQTISFTRFGSFLSEPTAQKISSGNAIMRIKGTVSYMDVFGDSHDIEVSGRYSAKNGIFRKEEDPDSEHHYKE